MSKSEPYCCSFLFFVLATFLGFAYAICSLSHHHILICVAAAAAAAAADDDAHQISTCNIRLSAGWQELPKISQAWCFS
ncbi:unnamed protein product [Prunus armeniaca]|uniref:Uncharacterized protein n=1 Tax=Prunus armeniaca TaxID=36596 RepID=A0A6J5YFA8_PRUAR|nr:unnamed protein product [Prunus armeniaca]